MILIALGSNLPSAAGPRVETLAAALAALKANGIVPLKVSRPYESAAWPNPEDPRFVNAVAQVQTTLEPAALLRKVHDIEEAFGRVRGARNAPRTLDLDILDYHGRVDLGPPQLPHPRMCERGFVLLPLAEIAPEWRHPISGKPVADLVASCDQSKVSALPLALMRD